MAFIAELLGWWFLAIVKFLFLPWLMIIVSGKTYLETVLVSTSGAAIGVFLISYFAQRLFNFLTERGRRKGKAQVTKRRRQIVGVKTRFGLVGLIAVSAFISVPISTLLAAKYFKHIRFLRLWLIVGFFAWANLLSLFALLVNGWLNG